MFRFRITVKRRPLTLQIEFLPVFSTRSIAILTMHKSRSATLSVSLLIVVLLLNHVTAESLTTTVNAGPSSNRVDIVFLGDGYQADELGIYANHIDGMLNHMFGEAEEPFVRYRDYFNVHRIDVISNESGADNPKDQVTVDTALNASYRHDGVIDRLLYIDNSLVNAVVARTLIGTDIDVDMWFVSVNSEIYGGGGGQFATFAGGNVDAYELALHEQGHSFSDLADEYEGFTLPYVGGEPREINVTISAQGAKWDHWLGYQQEGIGPIGVYEGGRYYSKDIYRPSLDSKMRTLGMPFDAVAREQIIIDIYDHVDPLDTWRDNSVAITDTQPLWVEPIDGDLFDFEWSVDGIVMADVTAKTLDVTDLGLFPGTYAVGVKATDSTDWVRRDQHKLQQQVFWIVAHYPGDFDGNQIISPEDMDLLTMAINDGSQDLRFDLNSDGVVSVGDRDRWLIKVGSFYGDADLDGEVAFADFLVLSSYFGDMESSWRQGNFDLDEVISFADFLLLSANYGKKRSESMFAVPEPGSATLAWLGLFVFAVQYRVRPVCRAACQSDRELT